MWRSGTEYHQYHHHHQPDGVAAPVYSLQSGLISGPDCIPALYTITVVSRGLSSQELAVMPAEDRRLVAEEGSYSLKTWLLKTEDLEAGRAPVSGPSLLVVRW